ncbi:hypothetical protein ACHAWF_000942 [Thalassiosira exigua]
MNVVLGCNHHLLTEEQRLVTNASCPVAVYELTTPPPRNDRRNDEQTLVDMPNAKKSNLRRTCSGMLNLCPTSTGSATAIVEIYPKLRGELNGLAIHVPLLNASLTDCVFEIDKAGGTMVEEVDSALKKASEEGPLRGLLGYETRPLVSTNYTNDTRLCVIDTLSTQVIDGTMVKIYARYGNECGYSKQMAELCHVVATRYVAKVEPAFEYE